MLKINRPSLPWISNKTPPEDRQLCLVILNGKIMIDIMVWHKKEKVFITHTEFQGELTQIKLRLGETDGWLSIRNIPLPEWVRPIPR